VLGLALPLVISTASWTVMHFVDRMFLLWHSTSAMVAAMPAGVLHFMLLCLPLGVAIYVTTFVAQYHGAGRPERIGLVVWQGLRIGLYSVPAFLALIPLAPWVFRVAGHAPEVARLEVLYFQTLCFGSGGAVVAAAMASFFTGRGETRVVMMVNVAAAALNVLLDYAWIFGRLGFPALGIEGAAWATVVSQWSKAAMYWPLLMRRGHRELYGLSNGRGLNLALMGRLLRYGGPNGLQMLLESSAFALFLLLVGRLGEEAMAATTLAFNVNLLAFVPMLGVGVALTTMVGQQLGRDRPDLAGRATWTSFWMAQAYMGTMAALYVLVPDAFLWGHASGVSPERFDELRAVTVVLLRFVAVFCLFDAMNVVFAAAIKGAGDTRFILRVNLVMAPLLVLGSSAGMSWLGGGLVWCWVVVTIWVCVLALIYLARFLQGRWREMRVIEPELLPEAEGLPEPEPALAVGPQTTG
jgi:MATE family multidrug resistance protein